VREKYCWLVADKPSEQGENRKSSKIFAKILPIRVPEKSSDTGLT
jgi:hypothetical protein